MANILTLIRIILIPIIILYLNKGVPYSYFGIALFILASITDYFDGYIARKKSHCTRFGSICDNIADKVLTLSLLIFLAVRGSISFYILILFAIREISVTLIRWIGLYYGYYIVSSRVAKFKTTLEMMAIVIVLFIEEISKIGLIGNYFLFSNIFMTLVLILSLFTGAEYLSILRKLYSQKKERKVGVRDRSSVV